MKASKFFLVVGLAAMISGCATLQVAPDPKAPVISIRGFDPSVSIEKNGAAVLTIGQEYRLVANVIHQDAPLVRMYKRLHFSIRGMGWQVNNSFKAHIFSSANCCYTVWTGWYWDPATSGGSENISMKIELEMWVVDAEGRESNHLLVPVITRLPTN